MARVVLIVDSSTGALIDVAGNVREGARYKKFVKRLLSLDPNPVLDYGANGGDSLSVSKGGYQGEKIRLDAKTVEVTGELTVGGNTVSNIAKTQIGTALDRITGNPGEIDVRDSIDTGTGDRLIKICLDGQITGSLATLESKIDAMDVSGYVSRSDLANVVSGIVLTEEDTLEDVKGKLNMLLERLSDLAGVSSPGGE